MQRGNEELAKIVHCTANVTAQWDSKTYDLSKGVKIALGVVEHWKATNPTVTFIIEEVKEVELPSKEIVNPLGEEGRGEAFVGLKRGRKPQGG